MCILVFTVNEKISKGNEELFSDQVHQAEVKLDLVEASLNGCICRLIVEDLTIYEAPLNSWGNISLQTQASQNNGTVIDWIHGGKRADMFLKGPLFAFRDTCAMFTEDTFKM